MRIDMKTLFILLSLFVISHMASAEVYKWVDDKGQVHYGDHPRGSHDEAISVDAKATQKADVQQLHKIDTDKLIKDMEKSRKQREKARHKKLARQRKDDEKCLKQRNKVRKLEARMHKHFSEFSNDRPAAYQRLQAELKDREKFLDEYCN